jgi:hypothetical protein
MMSSSPRVVAGNPSDIRPLDRHVCNAAGRVRLVPRPHIRFIVRPAMDHGELARPSVPRDGGVSVTSFESECSEPSAWNENPPPRAYVRGEGLLQFLLVFVLLLVIPISYAKGVADCIAANVMFSGAPALRYATVMGARDSRVDIYQSHPESCSQGAKVCRADAYVLPGDNVAIAKTCGRWAYVQYLGNRRITVGWVEEAKLAPPSAPPAPKPPHDPYTNVGGLHAWPAHYRFTLRKGGSRPVCEAYLQRLNQAEFYRPPYCGRPESTVVPGFVALRRQYLTAAEILHLVTKVDNFMGGIPQDRPDLGVEMGPSGAVRGPNGQPVRVPAWRLKDITGAMDIQVWRYIPGVDIGNDGKKDNVILWHGIGASNWDGVCGAIYANNPEGQYVDQRAFVLTPDGARIDAVRTKAVFGLPDGGYLGIINGKPAYDKGFAPIGYSIGIFQYKSAYYFDTFLNPDFGDFYGRRRNDKTLRYVLGVFEHKANRTREICAYEDEGAVAAEFLHSPDLRTKGSGTNW